VAAVAGLGATSGADAALDTGLGGAGALEVTASLVIVAVSTTVYSTPAGGRLGEKVIEPSASAQRYKSAADALMAAPRPAPSVAAVIARRSQELRALVCIVCAVGLV
jgi:hypothetical protein